MKIIAREYFFQTCDLIPFFSYLGDFRLNQNIELLVPDVLFLNFHNFLANALKDINKKWQNDDLYFNARRIATAAYQHIVSNEYIILLIGMPFIYFDLFDNYKKLSQLLKH